MYFCRVIMEAQDGESIESLTSLTAHCYKAAFRRGYLIFRRFEH